MSTIAVTGATGQLGRLIIEALKTRTNPTNIIALARNTDAAKSLGVTAREFDYNKPETLAASLAGVDKLLIVSGNEFGKRAAQHLAIINAAKAAGVKFVAYTSLLHADTSAITLLSEEHLATERDLTASGLPFAILRNGWYTENYTGSVKGAIAGGAFLGSAGDAKISSAARADYAEAAAIVLTTEGHNSKTYELAGDIAYTLTDLAAEISRHTGKTIPYKNLPEAEYAKILVSFGLPEPMAHAYAVFDTGAAAGSLFDESHTLSKLLGHPTTPLSTSVAAAI